mmetsp:Transcript_3131/g.7543  ORF Transcript_3131/g.7543 Transcript_3131/m.7543 type:complete len:197 (-) Transcript_3131:49-639(-)
MPGASEGHPARTGEVGACDESDPQRSCASTHVQLNTIIQHFIDRERKGDHRLPIGGGAAVAASPPRPSVSKRVATLRWARYISRNINALALHDPPLANAPPLLRSALWAKWQAGNKAGATAETVLVGLGNSQVPTIGGLRAGKVVKRVRRTPQPLRPLRPLLMPIVPQTTARRRCPRPLPPSINTPMRRTPLQGFR